DRAVNAARRAFKCYSRWSRERRLDLLERILKVYKRRQAELGQAVSLEMGAPIGMAVSMQAGIGLGHIQAAIDILRDYPFEQRQGNSVIRREPIGVCALITPWNWPV